MVGANAFVIREWEVAERPNAEGEYVRIRGRKSGLVSWFLALIGIEPTVKIRVTDACFFFEVGSWSGRSTRAIPLPKISSIFHGYVKPWKEALSLLVVLLGISWNMSNSAGLLALLVLLSAVIALVYYVLNKTLILGVFEVGGVFSGIAIKSSVIEDKKLDASDAEQVGNIVQTLILNRNN